MGGEIVTGWSDDLVAAVRRGCAAGISVRRLSVYVDLAEGEVRQIRRAYGILGNGERPADSEDDVVRAVRRLVQDRASAQEITAALGLPVSEGPLDGVAAPAEAHRRHGIQSAARRELINTVMRLDGQGLPRREIGEVVGVSASAVTNILVRERRRLAAGGGPEEVRYEYAVRSRTTRRLLRSGLTEAEAWAQIPTGGTWSATDLEVARRPVGEWEPAPVPRS